MTRRYKSDEERRERVRATSREWRSRPGNAERARATEAARRVADPEAWRARKVAAQARYAEKNADQIRARANAERSELRLEVIAAYGGRCDCPGCHVHHAALLTVDHVSGDGSAHRRANGRGTRDLYRWIKRQGFPPHLQLLCGSCNLAKADRDKCPLAGEDH